MTDAPPADADPEPKASPAAMTLFVVVCGVGCLAMSLIGVSRGAAAMAWPSAPAEVITSEVVGQGDERSAEIVAEFKVGSSYYRCGRVAFGAVNETNDLPTYPVGKQIAVRYRPGDPDQCVFKPGVSGGSIVFFAFAAGCFAFATYAQVSARIRLRSSRLP